MADSQVDLWATDEVHFQQHGSRCQMWVPPETQDPILLHHPTRRSVGYFGAVRLRDGKFFFPESPLPRQHHGIARGRRDHRQCPVSPCPTPSELARGKCQQIRPRLSAALQPRSQPNRTGVEACPAAMLTEPILPATQRGHRFRRGAICTVGKRQHYLASIMRNYLRRCV
jgi:hypothetical protein